MSTHDSQSHVPPEFQYGMYRSSSASSATGSMSPPTFIIERSESSEDIKFEYHRDCRLLNAANAKRYDCFKKAYADILYRWELLPKRTEILKFVDEVPLAHRGLDVLLKCEVCSQTQRDARCTNCKSLIVKCSVCRIGVKGLLSFCIACGHGGHTMHLMKWFQKVDYCATGCGCNCLKNGSINVEEDMNSGYYR